LCAVIIVGISLAKELPLRLADDITSEASVLTRIPPEKWQEVGYTGITRRLSDAVVDDSGNVHMVIDEHYRRWIHVWHYLRFDREGNEMCDRIVYEGKYYADHQSCIVSRVLVNPDMSVLVVYPDTAFYTCWVKLDKKGNVVRRNEPRWWKNDAAFRVCSAGQDRFHIISFPVPFGSGLEWTINLDGDSVFMQTHKYSIIPSLQYSNNFSLKKQKISLKPKYRYIEISRMLPVFGDEIFCLFEGGGDCYAWTMNNKGSCFDGAVFEKEDLADICFAKVELDTFFTRIGVSIPPKPDLIGLALASDSSIIHCVYSKRTLYLIKYDLNGQIIPCTQTQSRLVSVDELDKDRAHMFVSQIISEGHSTDQQGVREKSIFYWGFDESGNFCVQIY
jgi:hypothetical protein